MILGFGSGLSAGLGRAVSEIDRIFILVMSSFIAIELLLMIMTLIKRKRGMRVLLGIFSMLMLVPVIFAFKHEVKAYLSGSLLLLTSLGGLFTAFLARRRA